MFRHEMGLTFVKCEERGEALLRYAGNIFMELLLLLDEQFNKLNLWASNLGLWQKQKCFLGINYVHHAQRCQHMYGEVRS